MTGYILLIYTLIVCCNGVIQAENDCGFKCLNEKEFLINGLNVNLKCNGNEICNGKCTEISYGDSKSIPFCATVDRLCPYDCDENGNVLFELFREIYTGLCPENQTCNTRKDSCDMCIPKESAPETSPGTSTATSGESSVETTSQTSPGPSSEITSETSSESSPEMSSEAPSEASEETTSTTSSTVEIEPDCNKPSGAYAPCRYGPKGFYYKCVRASSTSYKPEKRSCESLKDDKTCRRYRLC